MVTSLATEFSLKESCSDKVEKLQSMITLRTMDISQGRRSQVSVAIHLVKQILFKKIMVIPYALIDPEYIVRF